MVDERFLIIMMSNVEPKVLRLCRPSGNNNDDAFLLRREMIGRSLPESFSENGNGQGALPIHLPPRKPVDKADMFLGDG